MKRTVMVVVSVAIAAAAAHPWACAECFTSDAIRLTLCAGCLTSRASRVERIASSVL